MNDTQWPTFEVFQQDRAGKPHRNAGSVHAPDAEVALLHARDVFVRRPRCLNMWVVPATMIFAKTAQELEDPACLEEAIKQQKEGDLEDYYVFQKQTQKASDTYVVYVGSVQARSSALALKQAIADFGEQNPWVWWICPARAVTRSEDDDIESMFEPALHKPYRYPQHYHTVAAMHKIKTEKNLKS